MLEQLRTLWSEREPVRVVVDEQPEVRSSFDFVEVALERFGHDARHWLADRLAGTVGAADQRFGNFWAVHETFLSPPIADGIEIERGGRGAAEASELRGSMHGAGPGLR